MPLLPYKCHTQIYMRKQGQQKSQQHYSHHTGGTALFNRTILSLNQADYNVKFQNIPYELVLNIIVKARAYSNSINHGGKKKEKTGKACGNDKRIQTVCGICLSQRI